MAAAVTYELAGLFASSLATLQTKEKTLPVLSTVEAQLSLHERNIAKAAPEAREWQKNYEQSQGQKLRSCCNM